MKRTAGIVASLLIFALAGLPSAWAEEKHEKAGKKQEMGKMEKEEHKKKISCKSPVNLTESAEEKLGGALYKGPLPKPVMMMAGMERGAMKAADVKEVSKPISGMGGAHNVHAGPRGGEFIMVPNNLHHMEVVYSLECGFQLFMYNAFTEPIDVRRFQGFILILPEGGDQFFEVMRFLTPSEDGTVLKTSISHSHDNPTNPKGIFEVELYMKFPENIHPQKFDLIVGTGDN